MTVDDKSWIFVGSYLSDSQAGICVGAAPGAIRVCAINSVGRCSQDFVFSIDQALDIVEGPMQAIKEHESLKKERKEARRRNHLRVVK